LVSLHVGWKALYTRRVSSDITLRDFRIEGAADLGECTGAQSFRATRGSDGGPVLLHKFRPAQSLVELGPLVTSEGPPDFTKPFLTQFTGLFVVASLFRLGRPVALCAAATVRPGAHGDHHHGSPIALHPPAAPAAEPLSRCTERGKYRARAHRQLRGPGRTPPLAGRADSGSARTPRAP
jgi:hypothetical protein